MFAVMLAMPRLATAGDIFDDLYSDDARYQTLIKQYDDLEGYGMSDDGSVIVVKKNKKGVVNAQNELIIPIKYSDIGTFTSEGKNFFIVSENTGKDDDWSPSNYHSALLDAAGSAIVSPRYNSMENMWNGFNAPEGSETLLLVYDAATEKRGVLDTRGNVVLPIEYDDIDRIYTNGCIFVKKDGKSGVMRRDGSVLLPLQYDEIFNNGDGQMFAVGMHPDGDEYADPVFAFYGYDGRPITDAIFIDASPYHFAGYVANLNNGKPVILKGFVDGIAPFYYNDDATDDGDDPLWGYMDTRGNVVVAPKFVTAESLSCGRGVVRSNPNEEKYGYIDNTGRVVLPETYDNAGRFKYGLAVTYSNWTPAVIDVNGNIVKTFEGLPDIDIIQEDGQTYIIEGSPATDCKYYDTHGNIVKVVVDGVTMSR